MFTDSRENAIFEEERNMNKHLKRFMSAALSAAVISTGAVFPVFAEGYTPIIDGDEVINEWKFDFGAEGSTPEEGYTLVTPDTNFVQNAGGEYQYGFLGTDEEDYNLTNRYDGWTTQRGQVIELEAGGPENADAIGVVGAGGTEENEGKDIFGNQADKYYPVRFALKVEDETYYRIKATVTTLDPSKDATASLYTERKHPLFTEKTIKAGETVTETFSVRVTPIYYEKTEPEGTIADEMVTVGVLGENAALASVEIQQVESFPTLWVLGDSTVTDGNTTLPFFPLQNFTGVGTGLTKYLRRDMAMVNEGEGGLNAADNYHFNMVKNRIKAGDYMYVEYGHNHKDDGPQGLYNNLQKYYNACKAVGANLIIVSPVQSVNSWNSAEQKWNDRFGGEDNFEGYARKFVEDKIAEGADNIAFVNLTKTSVEFVDKVTADNGNTADAARYYYQTAKNGGTDPTHPNDLGAENFAYCFFEAAKEVSEEPQKSVIAPIIENMTDELPNLVSAEVMAGGLGGSAWPTYIVPSNNKYPVVINDIQFDENGEAIYANVTVQDAQTPLSTYGIIIITVFDSNGDEKGKIYAIDQVDNSTGNGTQEITNFTSDVKLADGDTYTAQVVQAADTNEGLVPVEDGTIYSAVYRPTDIAKHLLVNDRNENSFENFDYYNAKYDGETTSLIGNNGWAHVGSAQMSSFLDQTTDGTNYVRLTSTGTKEEGGSGSFYIAAPLAESISGADGRYLISADIQYVSGSGMTFNLLTGWGNSVDKIAVGMELFTIDENGTVIVGDQDAGTVSALDFTNVQYVLDTIRGTGTVTVNGDDPVTVDLPEYQTTDPNAEFKTYTHFMFGAHNGTAFANNIANMTVAELKDQALPEYTVTLDDSDVNGSVSFDGEAETNNVTLGYTDGQAVISSDEALTAKLIEASYYDDGTLKSVKITDVILDGAGTQTYAASEGSTLMLWNSFDNTAPVCPSIQAAESLGISKTLPINTVVTVNASANPGYAFTGWYDSETLVSEDASYTFRLRGDITLTPSFIYEPSISEITDFSISAENTFIKADAGNTTAMKITNAVDANGTPSNSVTNADIAWSSDDENITVDENGIVTVGEGFTTGSSSEKTVTITGELNGISRTCVITFYSYDYYEEMTNADYTGLTMTIAGKSAIVFPAGKATNTYRLSEPVSIGAGSRITYSHAWSGYNTCEQRRTLNFKNSAGETIFTMYYSWNSLIVNGTTLTNAVSKDTWTDVVIEIGSDGSTVTVTAGGNSATTTLSGSAKDLASIDFDSAQSVPDPVTGDRPRALGISSIKVE